MRFPRKTERYRMQPPMTSLIDIVFLLLIYFLLTTNFIVEEGIKVKLPNARASAPRIKQEITVVVNREGTTFIAGREIPADALYTELKALIGTDTDRLVVIKADKTIVLNKAVRVMDIAKAAGASHLSLATEKGL
ncbi:MAG: biopolymer transporter ExbD [Desulfobacter sp.]